MRISKLILVGAACVFSVPAGAGEMAFASIEDALRQGIGAYQGGYYEQALPALEHAAAEKDFWGTYYLAKLYADNGSPFTSPAKAYKQYQRIVDEYADLDPDADDRAPYVGQSLTALANYVRRGIPEIGLEANLDRAIEYLHNASVIFNDEDAQFELAKLQLTGEGVEKDMPNALHWLSRLTQRGHAGAQAFLADLLWRGKYVKADKPRALALISVAVTNAPANERLWIEDIYQNIYCGSAEGLRQQAGGIVAGWGNRYGRSPEKSQRAPLDDLDTAPERTCQNGETVAPINAGNLIGSAPTTAEAAATVDGASAVSAASRAPVGRPVVMFGSSGAGLSDLRPAEAPRSDR